MSNLLSTITVTPEIQQYLNTQNIGIGSSESDTHDMSFDQSIYLGLGGDDIITGAYSADTYMFNRGDGQDTITDYNSLAGADDKIVFGAGITSAHLGLSHDATHTHLIIELLDDNGDVTGDRITVQNAFNNPHNEIESFEFADGSSMTLAEIKAASLFLYGSDGDDVLSSSVKGDTIFGLAGNDTVTGYFTANNTINGGAGDDVLGLSNNSSYSSSAYTNIFTGGTGNDIITGAYSADTYMFNRGDGQDTITDYNSLAGADDKIVFGAGITSAHLGLSHDATHTHLIIELLDDNGDVTGDRITVQNAFSNANYQVESVEFGDGSSMYWQEIVAATAYIHGGSGIDDLQGTDGADVLLGYAGNDSINAGADDDSLNGGLGNDNLIGGQGSDTYHYNMGDGNDAITEDMSVVEDMNTVQFGANIVPSDLRFYALDSDVLYIEFIPTGDVLTINGWFADFSTGEFNPVLPIQSFAFSGGSVLLATDLVELVEIPVTSTPGEIIIGTSAADTLVGTAGDDDIQGLNGSDKLTAGAGNDQINGGYGNDNYYYNSGDGDDVLDDPAGTDYLRFGVGISPADVSIAAQAGGDMYITVAGSGTLTVQNWFQNTQSKIEYFMFADGTSWDANAIGSRTVVTGSEGDDTWDYSTATKNLSHNGGLGDDIITGGKRDDNYYYNLGDGDDVVNDNWGVDYLRFGEGINPADVSITAEAGGDMFIRLADGATVTVKNWFQNTQSKIEYFKFADGTSWDANAIGSRTVVTGTDGNDTWDYSTATKNLSHNGGLGDDTITGGKRDDNYYYNSGDGDDVLDDPAGTDYLRFGVGISPADVSITAQAGGDMYITVAGSGTITLKDWFQNTQSKIEYFMFADGTSWDVNAIGSRTVVTGTDGNDTWDYSTSTKNLSHNGGLGDDIIIGGRRNDNYYYNLGDGNDIISDGTGTNNLYLNDIAKNDITVTQVDNDLIVNIITSGESITINNWFTATQNRMTNVHFSDASLNASNIEGMLEPVLAGKTLVSEFSRVDSTWEQLLSSMHDFAKDIPREKIEFASELDHELHMDAQFSRLVSAYGDFGSISETEGGQDASVVPVSNKMRVLNESSYF